MSSKDDLVTSDKLKTLLEYASKHTYKAKDTDIQVEEIVANCLLLLSKDYKFNVVRNEKGELCGQYPPKIPILECEKLNGNTTESNESMHKANEWREMFFNARFARCRSRFPVPVIICDGQYICRGATISGWGEIYGRTGIELVLNGGEKLPQEMGTSENQIFNRMRGHDILLLQKLNVHFICDLMVENKKVKFGVNVTSSEKVDKESRYRHFSLVSVPYPGCEFFRIWRDAGYMAEGLNFDWSQAYVDAILELASDNSFPDMIDWSQYKTWDLVTLTQNYLRLLLHYLDTGRSGILVHCISGWDRTPLFISLLRISLWADGRVHKNLSSLEIVYFTVAYDWFLFGHNFPDRMAKGEDIFFFCFNFLKYITSSIYTKKNLKSASKRHDSLQESQRHVIPDTVLLESELSNSRNSSAASFASTSSESEESNIAPSPQRHRTAGSLPIAACSRPKELAGYFDSVSSSWQMVNGCGSLHRDPVVTDKDSSASSTPIVDSERARLLDEARRTFLHCYTSLPKASGATTSHGGITGFLGNLAGKALGFGRSSYV